MEPVSNLITSYQSFSSKPLRIESRVAVGPDHEGVRFDVVLLAALKIESLRFRGKRGSKKGKKKKIEKSKNNEATAAGLAVYMSQGPGGFKASPTPIIFLTRYHLIQTTDYKFVIDKMMVLIFSKILKSLQYNLKIILNHRGFLGRGHVRLAG